MKRFLIYTVITLFLLAACSTAYKAQPVPFKLPSHYPNAQRIAGATIGAEAFSDEDRAQQAFGFDVRGAGMLPVQVVVDNQGNNPLQINPSQTFLEDNEGNLWPVLSSELAYERATKYAQTKEIFKKGAYSGFLGATAGALIGAAVGIVSGRGVGEAIGKGAVIGGAGGAVVGGASGYDATDARRAIIQDLSQKSLQNKPIPPKDLSYGFIFFPGEAKSARLLRLQVVDPVTGTPSVVLLPFTK